MPALRATLLSLAILVGLNLSDMRSAFAQGASASAGQSVALAPVSSVGSKRSKGLQAIEKAIEEGLTQLTGWRVVTARTSATQIKKSKKSELRNCEGDNNCLAKIGALSSCQFLIYAEVGGLGDSRIVYLKLIDVSSGKEVRSTTMSLAGGKRGHRKLAQAKISRAAATRLLIPRSYVGSLALSSSVPGATIYLDGHKQRSTTPLKSPIAVFVGSHALRVTHPEHRDYVRFVEIRFGETSVVKADMLPVPKITQKLSRKGLVIDPTLSLPLKYRPTPWYYKWYSVAGGVTAVGLTSAVLWGILGGGIDADLEKPL